MINYNLDGASSLGISHYSSFGHCPYRATRNSQNPNSHQHTDGTAEGTILHAYSDLYYQGVAFEPGQVEFNHPFTKEQYDESARVWRKYQDKFAHDEWTVIASEKYLGGPALLETMGVDFTAKLDLVVEISGLQAEYLQKSRSEEIRPGRYGVDHKFLKQTPTNLEFKYPNSLQFVGYHTAWNACYPDLKLDGFLVNVVIKNKEPKFITLVLDPPGPEQIMALKSSLKWWKYLKDNHPYQTNPLEDNCFPYSKPCYYFANGECDRSGNNLVLIGGK